MALYEHQMSKETLEAMWMDFGDVPVNDLDGIEEGFCGWNDFTDREDLWHWFDDQDAKWGGGHALLYPSEHEG